jgi:hypothetical protein
MAFARSATFGSGVWTVGCATLIFVLETASWARTGSWTPVTISDALKLAGSIPSETFTTASSIETKNPLSLEALINWLLDFPLTVLLLLIAALLLSGSAWIGSYEKRVFSA